MYSAMPSLAGISAYSLAIPFRMAFKHASASRGETATIWVQAKSEDGTVGCGEGCPREYVTGETVETALAFVDQVRSAVLADISDIASLREWAGLNQQRIDVNPAAWCAIELSLLDLLAKQAGESVESMLGYPELSGEYQYTAVLGDSSEDAYTRQLEQYSQVGFRDFKVKVSGDLQRDRRRIAQVFDCCGEKVRVRVDANNLWSVPSEAIHYVQGLDAPIYAVEEPLRADDYEGAASVADELGIPVVLDEGITRMDQMAQLVEHSQRWILNVRVSKLGGIARSLAIVAAARRSGLKIIIGAQVGETSLLTRAALTVANASRDILIAQEGAFGTLLLNEDVCHESLIFGAGGRLDVGERFKRSEGFGLSLDSDLLADLGSC